jgi:hypothetical protein
MSELESWNWRMGGIFHFPYIICHFSFEASGLPRTLDLGSNLGTCTLELAPWNLHLGTQPWNSTLELAP